MAVFIPRRLSFIHDRQPATIGVDEALADERLCGRPLVLLGEAGSGKSELLRHWGGDAIITARQLLHGGAPSQGRVFVDGFDEAAGLKDGDALDAVLGKLGAERNADFVLACRAADWRSASAKATIKTWTAVEPVELTIDALGGAEIIAFLEMRYGLDAETAKRFVGDYEARGFTEWLGNPQTLMMLADVTRAGIRPETTRALFELYVDKVWKEHRKQTGILNSASRSEVLDTLGAYFAALIIGGYDALTIAPGGVQTDRDLPLAEAKALPSVIAEKAEAFLDSRLVGALGGDRFAYQHRRIGEYLGARWLAERAAMPELRGRLLNALRRDDVVPSGLRGLWGWLAVKDELAVDIIDGDPLAILDYGSADDFGPIAARALLTAIERAEDRHETSGWRTFRAAALTQSALHDDIERILAVPGDKRFWTQVILLQQMRDNATVARHETTLRALMFDPKRPYAVRDGAADALADHGKLPDWPALIERLVASDDRNSLRLALVMMLNPIVGLTLDDKAFAETIYAYLGLTPRFTGEREVGTVSLYHHGRHQPIGNERLDGLLYALADCAIRYREHGGDMQGWDVERLFYGLLERRLSLGNIDAEALWLWLDIGEDDRHRSARDERHRIDLWLRTNDDIRRALQRKVLDTTTEQPRSIGWRLSGFATGLSPTPDDVVLLLNWLPEGDPRWRELIWLAPRREEGQGVRDAAARHVRTDEDRQALRDHANPPVPEWEIEQAKRQAKHEASRAARREELRANYLGALDRMRRGDWGAIAGPAQVYLGRVHEAKSDLPPEARIGAWIGEDLQAEAFVGFEAFLLIDPPRPTALDIADSYSRSKQWPAAQIIVAGLNERLRTGHGFTDLSDERLQAGLIELVGGLHSGDEWKPLKQALDVELARRGAFIAYARTLVEPQLKRRSTYPTGLWEILATPVGTLLAAEWLLAFSKLSAEAEEALIDHLLRDANQLSRDALVVAAKQRRRMRTLDDRRRRNWLAVELMLGLSPHERVAVIANEDRSFLWVVRNRMGRRRRDNETQIVELPTLLAAVFAAFAPLYPKASMPSGVQTGDTNAWDASDFLIGCLSSLSADSSAEASAALATLVGLDHGYAWNIGRSITDQRRARAEAEWQPIRVDALVKLVTDGPPIDHADLQSSLLAEFDVVQAKIKSSDADVWQFFYDGGDPKKEEPCSDALVTLLRQTKRQLIFTREPHLGDNREGDVWCNGGGFSIVVECKRHWHQDLWTAFDWQLARQQACDWRTRGYGVYVVYWFGTAQHALTGPPRGSGIVKPTTPAALETALRRRIADAGFPDIAVKVLDVSRP